MKYFIILMLICTPVMAAPNNGDTVLANKYLDSLENTQPGYKNINKKYEQVKPKMGGNKLVYWMDEYVAECGPGYIASVDKVINGKIWRIQRHTGCEVGRTIYTSWTQIN